DLGQRDVPSALADEFQDLDGLEDRGNDVAAMRRGRPGSQLTFPCFFAARNRRSFTRNTAFDLFALSTSVEPGSPSCRHARRTGPVGIGKEVILSQKAGPPPQTSPPPLLPSARRA